MPVDWQDYDGFDWAGSTQSPMEDGERAAVVGMVADLLELSESDRSSSWGRASPPGRFAATVIKLSPGLSHIYQAQPGDIGVKVFKVNADARRESERVVPFHLTELGRLPGLPNEHVQRSFDAGSRRDQQSAKRAFIVQQWLIGDTLEDWIRRRWPTASPEGAVIRSILRQLFGEIVIPLWGQGTIWWDFRDANYCYDPATDCLSVIDVDSLGACADEILHTPQIWTKRDKGRTTALARLRQMTMRLVLAQFPGKSRLVRESYPSRSKKKLETSVTTAWQTELEPALTLLGKDVATHDAALALRRFIEQLDLQGLFK